MGLSRVVHCSSGSRIFIIAFALCFLASPVLARESPRRVFLLEGMSAADASVQGTADAIRTRLRERSSEDIEVYSDFLDLGRFQGAASESHLVEFLKARFAEVRPEVVIPISRSAVEFAIRHRGDLIRDIPVVYCCTPAIPDDALQIPSDMAGVMMAYDWVGTVALAQRLQPNAKRLVVISGTPDSDVRRDRDSMKSVLPRLHNYDIRYLTGLPYDELLKEVSRLPRDSIVLLRRVFEDGSGRTRGVNLAAEISRASAAPVYSSSASYFGSGVIGGGMDSFKAQGAKAADLALEVLSGKDPAALPHQTRLPLEIRVDARALARWGFEKASLPAGTSVEFLEPTLWQQYRTAVSLAFVAFIVLGGIIASLLVQGAKLRTAKKLLKESEERIAFATASVKVGVWTKDFASGRLWATGHCRTMFGIDADAPLTWELFRDAVHPDDRQIFYEWLQTLIPSMNPTTVEFRVVMSGHSPRWYSTRQYKIFAGNGEPVQVCGVFADVTERKLAEEQAQNQREELAHMMRVSAVGELSAGLAHELSQPLAAILANAQAAQAVLAGRNQGEDIFAEIVGDVVREVDRASQVVHGLRRLLKKGKGESSPVSLNDLVMSTLPLVHSELVSRRIRIQTCLENDLPPISCDRVQIQQVILNLMMNAMDAMTSIPAQSRLLRVTTRMAEGAWVELSILDRGPGLSSDEFKKLFQPFFTTKPHGLGLGLSICSTIVKSHRGRLNIASAPEGGTVAVVWLPASIQLARAS